MNITEQINIFKMKCNEIINILIDDSCQENIKYKKYTKKKLYEYLDALNKNGINYNLIEILDKKIKKIKWNNIRYKELIIQKYEMGGEIECNDATLFSDTIKNLNINEKIKNILLNRLKNIKIDNININNNKNIYEYLNYVELDTQ